MRPAAQWEHPYYDPECHCFDCTDERYHFLQTGNWVRDPEPKEDA